MYGINKINNYTIKKRVQVVHLNSPKIGILFLKYDETVRDHFGKLEF